MAASRGQTLGILEMAWSQMACRGPSRACVGLTCVGHRLTERTSGKSKVSSHTIEKEDVCKSLCFQVPLALSGEK